MLKMRYKKNQYSEGFSICGLIIAGAFIYWGITTLIEGFRFFLGPKFEPLRWIGLIFLVIGISIIISQIRALTNRDKLRNIVKYEFESKPSSTIDEIVDRTKISKKDVQAIVLDLKSKGELRGHFSSDTGQMKPILAEAAAEPKDKFCPTCGTPVGKNGAQYCAYCGSKI